MIGIVSVGGYIPRYRLSAKTLARGPDAEPTGRS
jgi:3-hydroxy-3-methylglutaryl CoA synthase